MDHGDAQLHRGVVEQVAAGEVVGAVHHHVVAGQYLHDVVGPEPGVVGDHVHVGVEGGEGLLGRVDLALAHPVDVVEDLALQVRLVHHVHVHDAEGADAGRGQIHGGRGAQAARPQQQHLGLQQGQLALLAHLGHQQVPLVAAALLGGEDGGPAPGAALVLPLVEAAVHGDDPFVSQLGQGHGGEGRAHPARAHGHQRRGPVRDPVLDAGLELAPGDVDRALDGALLVFVGLAHVEEGPPLGQQLGAAGRVHLSDLRLGPLQQFTETGHGINPTCLVRICNPTPV